MAATGGEDEAMFSAEEDFRDEEEELVDQCRICRLPAGPGRPLRRPCARLPAPSHGRPSRSTHQRGRNTGDPIETNSPRCQSSDGRRKVPRHRRAVRALPGDLCWRRRGEGWGEGRGSAAARVSSPAARGSAIGGHENKMRSYPVTQ